MLIRFIKITLNKRVPYLTLEVFKVGKRNFVFLV